MNFVKFLSPFGYNIVSVLTMCMFCNLSLAQLTTMKAIHQSSELSCKLSSKKLMKRKETVLENLKNKVLETIELQNGYAFKFPGNDKVLDQLHEFIKTERTCCAFFIFGLSISGDTSETWLELTGPEGAKDFISEELGLVRSE